MRQQETACPELGEEAMTTNHSGGGTPITDASELDALVIDMPGQQTTDKVVRSIIARQLERNLSAAQSALAEKEREVTEWKKRQRADEDQLVWLAEWCRKFTGVDNNEVIQRADWPNRLVEVVAKAAEARAGEAEKDATRWRTYLAMHAAEDKPGVIASIDAALAVAPPASPTGRKE